jgi:DNA-binding transcriptional regulator YbjK
MLKMAKKPHNQASLDFREYENPVANKGRSQKRASPGKRRAKPQAAASLQPYLPGLSKRGRPRSKNPIPPSVRASESRKRRTAAGVQRMELLLEPAVAASLDLLTQHFNVSRVEIVSRLISQAAKRIAGAQAAARCAEIPAGRQRHPPDD